MTARRVAAYRHGFDRVDFTPGRPADDQRLQFDVADGVEIVDSFMTEYLRSRTRFFDRVVVGWIEDGGSQVVAVGAGYDGRSLRYAKPGVAWFELDHPDTQADKRQRLDRLGIAASDVVFAPTDFGTDDVGPALTAAGLDPDAPSLFICEGVAGYLTASVLGEILASLAGVAAPGSRLAMTVALEPRTEEARIRRQGLADAVITLGEPLMNAVALDDLSTSLANTGWRLVRAIDPQGTDIYESQSSSAYLVAVPAAMADADS